MISHCEGLGLQPNLKRGKTSILLRLAGKGAQAAKRAAFPKGEPRLHLRDLDVNVEIVANYTHLGGVLDHRGRMDQEARRRIAVAATAYDAGKQVLFGNRTIDLEARTAVFEATVRPTIFNLCLWVPGGSAWEKLNIGYTGLVRRLLQPTLQTKDVFKIPGPLAHILTGTLAVRAQGPAKLPALPCVPWPAKLMGYAPGATGLDALCPGRPCVVGIFSGA